MFYIMRNLILFSIKIRIFKNKSAFQFLWLIIIYRMNEYILLVVNETFRQLEN